VTILNGVMTILSTNIFYIFDENSWGGKN